MGQPSLDVARLCGSVSVRQRTDAGCVYPQKSADQRADDGEIVCRNARRTASPAIEEHAMLKPFAVKWSVALLILGIAAAAPALPDDPVAVQQQLLDALARGDVAGALALFTDDAVIDSESGFCASGPCVGKAAIQKDLERYVTDKSRRVTTLNTYVTGDVLLTRFEARSATIQGAGVERIILWGIREMRGDKIASSRCCLPERTDAQTARFIEWDYAHPSIK
jgi:ketosteroid isomerase-like protein